MSISEYIVLFGNELLHILQHRLQLHLFSFSIRACLKSGGQSLVGLLYLTRIIEPCRLTSVIIVLHFFLLRQGFLHVIVHFNGFTNAI